MERLTKPGQDFEHQFCDEVNCQFYGEPNGCNNPNYTCSSFCYFTSVAEALEKYEDTELTPELIEAMKGHNLELINQNEDLQAENAVLKETLQANHEFIDDLEQQTERLEAENAELKQRLEKAVELPCMVGDTVYADDVTIIGKITDIDIFVRAVWEKPRFSLKTLDYNNGQHLVHNIYHEEIAVNAFFDKAEAQAKLDEMKGGADECNG